MMEMGKAFIEWSGINLLAAQIMSWVTENGWLSLLILGASGVILVFVAAVLIINKLDRIPFNIPYARVLVPVSMVIAMLILLIVVGVGAAMYIRGDSGPPAHASPDAAEGSAGMHAQSSDGAAPDTGYTDRDLGR